MVVGGDPCRDTYEEGDEAEYDADDNHGGGLRGIDLTATPSTTSTAQAWKKQILLVPIGIRNVGGVFLHRVGGARDEKVDRGIEPKAKLEGADRPARPPR